VSFILLVCPVVLITCCMGRRSILLYLQHQVLFLAPAAASLLDNHNFLTNYSRSQISRGKRSYS
jgi:hypothetical protein